MINVFHFNGSNGLNPLFQPGMDYILHPDGAYRNEPGVRIQHFNSIEQIEMIVSKTNNETNLLVKFVIFEYSTFHYMPLGLFSAYENALSLAINGGSPSNISASL